MSRGLGDVYKRQEEQELIRGKHFIDVTFAMEADKQHLIKVSFLLHKLVLLVKVRGMLLIKHVKHVGVLVL